MTTRGRSGSMITQPASRPRRSLNLLMRSVSFCDTTLRDGQQAAGVAFSVDDAVDIVQILGDELRAAPAGSDGEGLLAGVVRDADGLMSVVRVDVLVSRLVSQGARRVE